jgi:hypothetical protein
LGGKGTKRRSARNHGIFGMHLLASGELLNKVKYRNKDSTWMFVVHFFSTCRAPIFSWERFSTLFGGKMLESGALFLGATFGTLQSESLEPLLALRDVFTSRRAEIPVERRVMTVNV